MPLNDEDSSGKIETRGYVASVDLVVNEVQSLTASRNTLAQVIQSMDHSAFLSLCMKMYDVLLARITMVKTVGEIMEEAVQSLS